MQSQVTFNRVPEKALVRSGEGRGGFGAEPGQVQQGSEEGRSGSGEGSRKTLVQSQVRFNRICGHLTHGNPAEVFPALGSAARFRKKCKNKTLRQLGIPPKLIYVFSVYYPRDPCFLFSPKFFSFTVWILSHPRNIWKLSFDLTLSSHSQ